VPETAAGTGAPAGAEGVLRAALELAFDIARIGARSTPPVEAPRAVRPFLHFTKRLPDGALAALRRGLDEDEGFRGRVAALADEGELGRAGWLLVVRPDGWEGELAGILDEADAKARAALEEKEERSARRRLAHAEQATERAETAAARARAELAAATTELAAERRSGRVAQDDVAQLTRKVASLEGERDSARRRAADSAAELERLRAELEGARREAAQAGTALRAAEAEAGVQALQAQAAKLRDEVQDQRPAGSAPRVLAGGRRQVPGGPAPANGPVAAGPPAGGTVGAVRLGDGPATGTGEPLLSGAGRGSGGPDLQVVADAVSVAAAAASTLGRALAEASAALTPPPPPSEPAMPPAPARRAGVTSASRRRPAGLPPAVFDDTTEAAAHLVRVPNALVLVDGYNAAKVLWPDEAPLELRMRLVDALSELVARTGAAVHVVYDGADLGMPPSGLTSTRGVRMSFSPADVEADDVILDLVDAEPVGRVVVVASSDRRVRDGARRRGANVISSAQLAAVLGRS